jgi:hypothetical protein
MQEPSMLRRFIAVFIVASGTFVALCAVVPVRTRRLGPTRSAIAEHSFRLPLTFEQSRNSKTFFARTPNYELSLDPTEAVLAPYFSKKNAQGADQPPQTVRMRFVDANPNATIQAQDASMTVSNYFIGNDPKKWRVHVPRFRTVRVNDLYDGIDLVYYGKNGELEHDLVVAPGKSPAAIRISFSNSAKLKIDGNGDLIARLKDGELRMRKPKIYQENGAAVEAVYGGYSLDSNLVEFTVGKYDHRRPLVIDPVLVLSTYLGGSDDDGIESVAVDSSGNIYVVGATASANFPLENPFQATPSPTVCGTPPTTFLCGIGFITKFNPSGSSLIYSTYFGGTGQNEEARSLVVDANENVYVAGTTSSSDFPATSGAYSTTFVAGQCGGFTCREAYVAKFDSSGAALAYATYLGSVGDSHVGQPRSLAVDGLGRAFVTGTTTSISFPTTAGAFQPSCNLTSQMFCYTAFVSVLNQAGSALVYSTYLGGSGGESGNAIAVNATGNAFVTGVTTSSDFPLKNPLQTQPSQGFFAKLTPDGTALVFSSYLGGSNQVNPISIALDANENIYLGGWTSGTDYPTTPGAYLTAIPSTLTGDYGFVTKIDSSGGALAYSSYLIGAASGANQLSFLEDIAVDSLGQAYVTGFTTQAGWPQVNAILPNFVGGTCSAPGQNECNHPFVTVFNGQGSALVFSTYLGGMNTDAGAAIALDQFQSIYAAGETNSSDFPVASAFQPAYGGGNCVNGPCFDGYLAKLQIVPLSVAPIALTFSQNVGSTSAPQNLTISNASAQAIPITSISTATGFSQTNTCSAAIPAGSSCIVSVSFSPTVTGPASGSLAVNFTGTGGTLSVPLTGTGTQPIAAAAPASLQFASQAIGSPSAAQVVTLSNTGSGALSISSIDVSGDFSQTNACGTSIAAGSNCSISVVFTPQAAGVRNGQITINDNSSSTPQTVSLAGTGSGAVTGLTPASVQFSPQTVGTISAAQTVTLTNNGNSALTISSINVTGDFGQTNTCGAMIAAGSSCAISVTFSPGGVGSRTGMLTVTDNSFGSPHVVALSGTGVSFTLGPSGGGPTSVTVNAGTSASFKLQAQGVAGFSGSVGLSANCDSVPLNTSCALSASSIQLSGTTAAMFTLTVGTTAKSRLTPFFDGSKGPRVQPLFWAVTEFLAVFAIWSLIAVRRRNWTRAEIASSACSLAFVLLTLFLASCSSGSGGGGSSGTTPGTYTVTVTASLQGASQTQNLVLIVR